MTLSNERKTNVLIRLRGCAGWSAPLLFTSPEDKYTDVILVPSVNVSVFSFSYGVYRYAEREGGHGGTDMAVSVAQACK